MNTVRTTRRDFIKSGMRAAGTIAFPAMVPASVFGRNAPSNRVTLAAIGVGSRGSSNNWNGFAGLADVRYLAAADPFSSRREKFAAKLNQKYGGKICQPYADFREVLARDDIDGVVVSTPDHWHVPIAVAAAKAGKDMYVEKPLGVALAWAWKLREVVAQNKVIFQYGTQQRSARQFRSACELVRNGYIGQVTRVEAWCPDMSSQFNSFRVKPYGSMEPAPVPDDLNYDLWLGPAPKKPYTVDRCTRFGAYHIYDYALGFIAGWGAHPLDIAQWGLDMDHSGPVKVEGTGKLPPQGSLADTTESWDMHCEYGNGIPLRFMGHRVAEPVVKSYHRVWRSHGTTFFGTDGWVSVDRSSYYASDPKLRKATFKPTDQRLYESPSQARNFIDCMKSRKPTINPVESAIRSDTISHLSDISIRLSRPIRWDPDKEQIIGDDEATKMLDRPLREPWVL